MDVHPTKNVSIGIDPYPYKSGNQKELMQLGGIELNGYTMGFEPKLGAVEELEVVNIHHILKHASRMWETKDLNCVW